jgi:LysM repeat protein
VTLIIVKLKNKNGVGGIITMLKKIMIFLVAGLFAWACNTEDENAPVKSIVELQERVTKINTLNDELEGKRTQLYSLIREFNTTRNESEQFDIASLDTLMGAEEKDLLRAMFKEEKNISYDGLLKNIIEKNNEIASLSEKITGLEAKLPKPYEIKKGDTHYALVKDFLMTNYDMDRKQVREIAWKTAMVDNILPGNKVWMVYADSILATYVTQGTAKVAPMTVQVLAKKQLLEKAFEEGRTEGLKQVDTTAADSTGRL